MNKRTTVITILVLLVIVFGFHIKKYGNSDTVNEGYVFDRLIPHRVGHPVCVGYETRGDEGAGFFLNDAIDC